MITCDYCLGPAERRVHADHLTTPITGADFDAVATRASLLMASRYACHDHLPAAVGHMGQLLGDDITLVLDAEL